MKKINKQIVSIKFNNKNFKNIIRETIKSKNDYDVIIIKNFELKRICQNVINETHSLMKKLPSQKYIDGNRFSFDVFPMNTKTNRVYRNISINTSSKMISTNTLNILKKLSSFQQKYVSIKSKITNKMKHQCHIFHYPIGGGFFDWHEHARFPVNYGLIFNLSQKGKHFLNGGTEIISGSNKLIKIENYSDVGDLILFKYDLKHRVSPIDSSKDLTFTKTGRWTIILPIS